MNNNWKNYLWILFATLLGCIIGGFIVFGTQIYLNNILLDNQRKAIVEAIYSDIQLKQLELIKIVAKRPVIIREGEKITPIDEINIYRPEDFKSYDAFTNNLFMIDNDNKYWIISYYNRLHKANTIMSDLWEIYKGNMIKKKMGVSIGPNEEKDMISIYKEWEYKTIENLAYGRFLLQSLKIKYNLYPSKIAIGQLNIFDHIGRINRPKEFKEIDTIYNYLEEDYGKNSKYNSEKYPSQIKKVY